MSLIEHYFGQQPENLTYQHIVDFFAVEREESDKIEFKAYVAGGNEKEKENGVIRSVSAFLNSSGGLLIWGAPTGQRLQGHPEKVFVGALSPVNRAIGKDYFLSRITDSITPAPNNIFFYSLRSGQNYVYIIEVQPSEYSPHQFQSIYNMRIDGQTKSAPHHYIEALFKKITYPKLNGYIKLDNLSNHNGLFYLRFTGIIFNLSRLQNEHKGYFRVLVTNNVVFRNSQGGGVTPQYFMGGSELRSVDSVPPIYYNQPYRFTDILQINPQNLQQQNSEFEIWFYFAGGNSPLRLSKYTLRLNFSNAIPQDLNTLFVSIDENKYFYEHSDALGLTEQQRISQIVGR